MKKPIPPNHYGPQDSNLKNLIIHQNRMLKRMANMDDKLENQIKQMKEKINQL